MTDSQQFDVPLPQFVVEVEKGALQRFARALGEDNPIYHDEAAAKAAGFRSIVAMPTYPIVPGARDELNLAMVVALGMDPTRVVHGSQRYVTHREICAGDRLTGQKRIVGVHQKKALRFIETVLEYRDDDGRLVCEDFCTLVVRP